MKREASKSSEHAGIRTPTFKKIMTAKKHDSPHATPQGSKYFNPTGLTISAWRHAWGLPLNGLGDSTETFLEHTIIISHSTDPEDAPGLHHECTLFSDNNSRPLDINKQKTVKDALLKKYRKEWVRANCSKGQTIGGRWIVTKELTGASESCNQGIFYVRDRVHTDTRIMKLLPTEAMDPGYATCEIDILAALRHRNIVEYFDGFRSNGYPQHSLACNSIL
jgi:hypothetical protein